MLDKILIEWDIGGVLLKLNYGNFYEGTARLLGISTEEFKQVYIDSKLEFNSLRGVISYEEHQSKLRQIFKNPRMSREELEKIATKVWGGEIPEVVNLKERTYFKNNGRVLSQIFSNIDQFAWEYLSREYPRMLQNFRPDIPPICSYLIGDVKPALAMYKKAQTWADRLCCSKVILIEDKPKYLEPAIEHFGWHGIHLTINQDPDEAIKQVAGHNSINTKYSDKIFVANSVSEMEQYLSNFGIDL